MAAGGAKKATKKKPAAKKARKKPAAKKRGGRVTPKRPPTAEEITAAATTDGVFDPRAAVEQVATQYPGFPFNSWDGNSTHELPNPLTLDPVQIQQALGIDPSEEFDPDDLDDLDVADWFKLLEELVPDAWGAIQQMPIAAREQVLRAWTIFMESEAGVEGKGRSPSSAPNRAGRRSKQT